MVPDIARTLDGKVVQASCILCALLCDIVCVCACLRVPFKSNARGLLSKIKRMIQHGTTVRSGQPAWPVLLQGYLCMVIRCHLTRMQSEQIEMKQNANRRSWIGKRMHMLFHVISIYFLYCMHMSVLLVLLSLQWMPSYALDNDEDIGGARNVLPAARDASPVPGVSR